MTLGSHSELDKKDNELESFWNSPYEHNDDNYDMIKSDIGIL